MISSEYKEFLIEDKGKLKINEEKIQQELEKLMILKNQELKSTDTLFDSNLESFLKIIFILKNNKSALDDNQRTLKFISEQLNQLK
jgi:hypothetical protein